MRSAAQLIVSAGLSLADLPDDLVGALRCPVRVAHAGFVGMWHPDVLAITLPGVIFVRPGVLDAEPSRIAGLIVHELVHVAQWRRWGTVGFLARYTSDYVKHRRDGWSHSQAYLAVRFEVDARARASHLRSSVLHEA